jgi:ATP-binding cassette subfamily B protein
MSSHEDNGGALASTLPVNVKGAITVTINGVNYAIGDDAILPGGPNYDFDGDGVVDNLTKHCHFYELVFEDVSFGYGEEGEKLVISDLNLKIEAGKTLALVGPSGGGKSTLCNLIPRFYNVSSGRITLDGVDTKDITLSSLRSNIGIVSQSVFLFDGTVRENIAYGAPDATDEEIVAAAKRANIHDFVSSLERGYETHVGERGVKLSGGQRQRIAIARVFLKNPKLLILDEATSALDNATEMQIQSSLEELSRGRTVIVVAHRLSTVKGADEIVVVDSNGVAERGTHDELVALDGEYNKLYKYQFRNI